MLNRSLFDAPQGINRKTFFVPTLTAQPEGAGLSRPRLRARLRVALIGPTPRVTLVRWVRTLPALAKALFRALQRLAVAEAVLVLTAALCVLAGLPAVLTAFLVALVNLVVNVALAVLTLGPVVRRLVRGRA